LNELKFYLWHSTTLQLGWLTSAEEWQTLRQIHYQFTHDYPGNPTERFERLQTSVQAAKQFTSVLARLQSKVKT
jgi:hypothetical protein